MSDATNRTDVDERDYVRTVPGGMSVRFMRHYDITPDAAPSRWDWYFWTWQQLFRNYDRADVGDL
jgi:hypothetical protein